MSFLVSTRRPILEALLAGVAVAVILAASRTPPELLAPGVFRDDGVYLAVGRAIAEGHGYHSLYLPGAPLQVKYPPGLPLIHALLWTIFGSLHAVYLAAGVLSVLATAAAGALIWYIGRSQLELSPIIVVPLAIGPLLLESAIQYYTLPITEAWYVLLWALVVLVAFRVCDASNQKSRRDAFVLGLLAAAAMLIRSQAVALFVALVPALFFARRRREAAIAGITAALPLGAWQIWLTYQRTHGAPLSSVPDESSYIGFMFHGTLGRAIRGVAYEVRENIKYYIDAFAQYLNPSYRVGVVLCVVIAVLAAIGAWRSGRRRLILPLTIAASGSLTLMWPWQQDRLLIPLLPFAGLLAGVALQFVAERIPRTARIAGACVLGLAGFGAAYQQISLRTQAYEAYASAQPPQHMSPTWYLPQNSRVLLLESAWIAKHARPSDRLFASSPAGLYLLTGLRGLSSSPAESNLVTSVSAVPGRFLAKAITDDSVSLVLVEALDDLGRDVNTLERSCPNAFHLEGKGREGFPVFLRVVDTNCIARTLR